MAELFLEVFFTAGALRVAGFEGRDEIGDPLDDALQAQGFGEVTGGGSGTRGTNIDIEIADEAQADAAVALIQQVLRGLRVPKDTIIRRPGPKEVIYRVYE